jgi:hypothetical protein
VPEEREGLFDTIQRSKNHYQKRAYQCIKCMVTLFSKCRPANQMLHTNEEVKRKWTLAVEWLQDELERVNCFVHWMRFWALKCFGNCYKARTLECTLKRSLKEVIFNRPEKTVDCIFIR